MQTAAVPQKKNSKKVQLVLGGGGARGIAHIQVIERLKRDGYEIERIIGCSMGAVVGGIYCTGFLDVYRDWLLTLNRTHLFRLMDFTLTNIGFLKGERVLGKMQEITGSQQIEDLKIPFLAVATDMLRGKEVVFDHGDLYAAMRASMSIPGIFTPVIGENFTLVDGGVLNPLPLNLADYSKDSLVVAVSLNGKEPLPNTQIQPPVEQTLDSPLQDLDNNKNWINRILNYGRFGSANVDPKRPMPEHPKLSLVNLLANSYEMTQDKLVELTVHAYKPDILIEVPRSSCGLFDFHRAQHQLDVGAQCYERAMKRYQLEQ